MSEQTKKKSIGGIWIKSGQYGDYLSISVEINGVKHNFTAFQNKYKEHGDKKPDYTIPEPKPMMSLEEKASIYKTPTPDKYQAKLDEVMKLREIASQMQITDQDVPF
jgi:hypothetical protein